MHAQAQQRDASQKAEHVAQKTAVVGVLLCNRLIDCPHILTREAVKRQLQSRSTSSTARKPDSNHPMTPNATRNKNGRPKTTLKANAARVT